MYRDDYPHQDSNLGQTDYEAVECLNIQQGPSEAVPISLKPAGEVVDIRLHLLVLVLSRHPILGVSQQDLL